MPALARAESPGCDSGCSACPIGCSSPRRNRPDEVIIAEDAAARDYPRGMSRWTIQTRATSAMTTDPAWRTHRR